MDSFPRYRHGEFRAKAIGGFSSQPEELACVHIPWKFHLFKLLLIFFNVIYKKVSSLSLHCCGKESHGVFQGCGSSGSAGAYGGCRYKV